MSDNGVGVKRIRKNFEEHDHQCTVVEWFDLQHPKLSRLLFAVPNAARRTPRQGAWMKAEGMRAGTADLVLLVARHGFHGLCIEMKALDGRATASQLAFLEAASEQGYMAVVCRGAGAAIETIRNYLR
jgi:hypothetical protein